jgi:hypothetical protein
VDLDIHFKLGGIVMTREERISMVASGTAVAGVQLYWDSDDGPAYRDGRESGSLEFAGWANDVDGTADNAYHIADFFGRDGEYVGPDQHGLHPLFIA